MHTACAHEKTAGTELMRNHILQGHNLVEEPDLLKWAQWLETADRVVEQTSIGASRVSTVFVGCGPMLFETRVFGGELGGREARCSTWEEAEKMHAAMCQKVKACESLAPKELETHTPSVPMKRLLEVN